MTIPRPAAKPWLIASVAAVLTLSALPASADYVGTQTNRFVADPDGVDDVLDGYHVGDRISFIAETTPANNGDRGIAAWTTIYVPAGVRVVGLNLVRPAGDGTYQDVPALDVAPAHNDCGNRGCAFPTTGTYQNGRVNEVQQDTGVFYSTDPQTALLGTPLVTNPTGTDVSPQSAFNRWDFNQTRAFGEGGAFSGNGGKGNTPLVQIGGTWFGTGSPVAGPSTYYRNDYDPTCDPGTGTAGADFRADLGCTGPWIRIKHDNAKIGGSGAIVPATTGAAQPLVNTAVVTSGGHDFAVDGPLPANTNAARIVQGIRRIGDLETSRITFEITDPAAFTAAFTNNTFCLDGTGGDLDKGDPTDPGRRGAQDNPWRYYEGNNHQCFMGSANGLMIKQAEFVNGLPDSGAALSQNDIVGYSITLHNTSGATLFDIDLSDTRITNLELVAASTAGCPYANYNGNQGGLPTLATLTATTATWNRLDSLAAGASVTVHVCGRVTTSTLGAIVRNRGSASLATVDGGAQQTVTADATGAVSTRITGSVFSDDDGNSAFSAGDSDLAGVTVRLYTNNGGMLGTLLATTTTNLVGDYEFAGFASGNYFVVAEDLPFYTSVRDIDTAPPCSANACNQIAVTLSGSASTGNNFLDRPPVRVRGTVFGDQNEDGVFNLVDRDFGRQGVTVRLFRDANNDGVADSGTPEATMVTGADGSYEFVISSCNLSPNNCQFVLDIDTSSLPAGFILTTDNFEEADFTAFGQTDSGNNFGYTAPPVTTLTKTSSGSGTDIIPGGTVTYTIRPRNPTTQRLVNARVSDPLPPQTSFVAATPPGFTGAGPVDWALGSNALGIPGAFTRAPVVVNGHPSTKGTFIDEDKPDDNDGADAKINLKTDAGKRRRGLVEWNLTSLGIPAGSQVVSATLSFYVTDDKNVTVNVHRLNRSWTEGTGDNATGADWESPSDNGNPPTVTWTMPGAGGDFVATSIGSFNPIIKNARAAVNAASLVQFWLDNPASNFGVILLATGANGEAKIGSDDNANPPHLNVTYIPPGSTTTSLAAAGSLVGDGEAITLTLTVSADDGDSSIDPPNPTVSGSGGASAVCDGSGGSDADWSPSTQALSTSPPTVIEVTFTRTCVATAGSLGGGVAFDIGAPAGDLTYAGATSNSVLVTPDLTLTVQLDDPLNPWAPQFTNTATLLADGAFDVQASARDVISRGGTVGDRVWLDSDGDGVQDIGEIGIPNVEITLFDAGPDMMPGGGDDVVVATAMTGANGTYQFGHLTPGTYFTDVTSGLPGGLALAPGGTDPSATVTVTAEEVFLDLDFGYVPTDPTRAAIGDRVWSDADQDGTQDPGEVGIGGVTVELKSAGSDGVLGTGDDVIEATTTTAGDGTYLFTGVVPGEYIVEVDEASAALTGYAFVSGPHSVSNASPPITVAAGDIYAKADFAYFNAATFSASDRLWVDADGDGVQDPGEPGIAGVELNLLDGGGNVVATTTTDGNGNFVFSGLANGNYTLDVADLGGLLKGLGGTTAAGTAGALAIMIAGADVSGVNFGYNAPGAIGDTIFSDHDGDGVQDSGELGLSGVSVQLWSDADNDGVFDSTVDTLVGTAVTAADGSYLFEGHLPDTYFVSVDDSQAALAGYAPTTTDHETGGNAAGTQIEVVLDSLGASFLDADFGYRNTALADVSGNVFEDLDRDGIDDGVGEAGFTQVTLALLDASGVIVATTRTDASGDYTFFDVPAGDYTVAVTDVDSILDGYQLTSGLDRRAIAVAAADISGIDFGYVREPGAGSIGDTVWLDVDPPGAAGPDGVRGPNEAGLAGVTVSLYRDLDGDGVAEPGGDDGAAIATTVTNANGDYLFDGLVADGYFVDVDQTTLPVGLTTTVGTTDPSSVIGLSEGERYEDADFGYVPAAGTAILGDRIWSDADGDGLQDAGEVGIAGVTVLLGGAGPDNTFGTGDDTSFSTITDSAGNYLFTNLPPSDYQLTYDVSTLPAGFGPDATNLGTGQRVYQVTAAAGDVYTHLDFGFDGPAVGSIGDRIWLDQDGDGNEDVGEPGIEDVSVNLVGPGPNMVFGDADDEILATTRTGVDGAYLFSGLALGENYQVQVSDLGGVLAELNQSTAAPGTLTPTAGTPSILTADFGFAPSGGTGSIGSNVWRDLDANGVRGAGEPALEGVTIDIYHDVDGDGVLDPGLDNLVRTVVTDVNGEYEVKGLPFGNYLVDVTDTAGVLTGFIKTSGAAGVNDNSQADPYAVTLSAISPNNETADFGYRDDAVDLPATITGTVFIDDDSDAIFDGGMEPTVLSAAVFLHRILANGARVLVGRTVSDASGNYTFSDLPPGDYEVSVSPAATSAEGYLQTTQASSGGVQPILGLNAGQTSADNDFGFFDGGVTTTPVTLSSFFAIRSGDTVDFEWTTENEIGNVGFALYGEDPHGNLVALTGSGNAIFGNGFEERLTRKALLANDLDLIRAHAPDSLTPSKYQVSIDSPTAERFWLVDLDLAGTDTWHGPFEANQQYGAPAQPEAVNWNAISQEALEARGHRHGRLRGTLTVGLAVSETGLHRVTYEQLEAAGMGIRNVPVHQLSLTRPDGEQLAMHHEGDGNVMEPGHSLTFYGEALDTLYTTTNVYRLARTTGTAGERATQVTTPPGSVVDGYHYATTERRDRRAYNFASLHGSPWFMDRLYDFGGGTSIEYELTAENGRPGTARLQAGIAGVTDFAAVTDHHVELRFNQALVATRDLNGRESVQFQEALSSQGWTPGSNIIRIELDRLSGALYSLIDTLSVGLRYPRNLVAVNDRLDFTLEGDLGSQDAIAITGFTEDDVVVYGVDGHQLVVYSSARVESQGSLHAVIVPEARQGLHLAASATNRLRTPRIIPWPQEEALSNDPVDYLIVAHPDFMDGIQPLAQFHRGRGLTVDVVDVEAIYRQRSGGVVDPNAIDAYIAHAASNRGVRFVLLVGGDSYDYRNDLGLGAVSFLPSYYRATGQLVRYTPTDTPYADVDGDDLPDIAIGRFPVRNRQELDAIVAKTLAFAELSYPRTALFASDNTDRSGLFKLESQALERGLAQNWSVTSVPLDDLGSGEARRLIIDGIESGVALTSYFGHSGPTVWAQERIFSAADAQGLTNSGAPTAVVQWGCWNTYFVSPYAETLMHKLLLSGPQGAAAVLGAATLTHTQSDRYLGRAFLPIATEPGMTIGEALTRAKQQLAVDKTRYADVLFGFSLMGDPALTLDALR